MDQLTKDLSENQKILDSLLGVGRNYDLIHRDLYIGTWKGRLYVIDTSAGEFFCVNHSAVVESLQQEDGLSDKGPSKDLVDFIFALLLLIWTTR